MHKGTSIDTRWVQNSLPDGCTQEQSTIDINFPTYLLNTYLPTSLPTYLLTYLLTLVLTYMLSH